MVPQLGSDPLLRGRGLGFLRRSSLASDRSGLYGHRGQQARSVGSIARVSDPTDAEGSSWGACRCGRCALPSRGGEVEMIRMLKSARDSAVKAAPSRQPVPVVTAAELREMLGPYHQRSSQAMQNLPSLSSAIPGRRPCTLFVPWPAATVSSVKRCGTWGPRCSTHAVHSSGPGQAFARYGSNPAGRPRGVQSWIGSSSGQPVRAADTWPPRLNRTAAQS